MTSTAEAARPSPAHSPTSSSSSIATTMTSFVRRTIFASIVALVSLPHATVVPANDGGGGWAASAQETSQPPPIYYPFGYQSDSTHSVEYRAKRRGDIEDENGRAYLDPSSYVGSIVYDPLHHALYVVGQTYASGPGVLDGVDVYDLEMELEDENVTGDPLWWENMGTGLRPHHGDVGIPDHGPYSGDCYYAILALPLSGPVNDLDTGGVDAVPGGVNSGGIDMVHRVKLLHSRRFGSDIGSEGCSAMDVLLPTAMDVAGNIMMDAMEGMLGGGPGGFYHDFEHYEEMSAPTTPSPAVVVDVAPPTDDVDEFGTGDGGRRRRRRRLGRRGEERMDRALQDEMMDTVVPPPATEYVRTRSVRLLMAGHVETADPASGYVVSDLANAGIAYPTSSLAYAFAQQVDVRLPSGNLDETTVLDDIMEYDVGDYASLDYALHSYGMEEDELAQELEKDFKVDVPRDDFLKIVTSGIESRAIMLDDAGVVGSPSFVAAYPVSLVADPTTKRHYYATMIASESSESNPNSRDCTIGDGAVQRSWMDYENSGIDPSTGEYFGLASRPQFGSNYRVILKKMSIETNAENLTEAEMSLSGYTMDDVPVAMRHGWMQEFRPVGGEDVRPTGLLFAPSGNADGTDDMLVMVGTTAGRGSAFGTADEGGIFDDDAGGEKDLDGFVTKVRADTGAFAGEEFIDMTTNNFEQTWSKRIYSNPGRSDVVASVCARPLRAMGVVQEKMEHVYVVGSTSSVVSAVLDGVRSDDFLSRYPVAEGSEDERMEAFLMKIDLSTMGIVWTAQVGAIVTDGDSKLKGSALGYGCAVTRDGLDVYLTGLVTENGVVTDFSDTDLQDGVEGRKSMGGTDFFVSSYNTDSGARKFLKQVGSTKDDYPSRGNGGITTDRLGNAIITGNTRGSLMRSRSKAEFIYGPSDDDAAMDIFIMSLDRLNGDHVQIATDTTKEPEQAPEETEEEGDDEMDADSSGSDSASEVTDPDAPVTTASAENSKKNTGALVGIIAVASVFIMLSFVAAFVIVRRIKKSRNEAEVVNNNTNLHGSRRQSIGHVHVPQKSAWRHHNALNPMRNFNPDVKVEVRNSASGGWHGVYDEDNLQTVDFGVPGANNDGIIEQSLFMEDEVREIEGNLDNYVIGEMDNDVSDEDLIKAYNDAMAVEIEPESPDVEFAMSGVGSSELSPTGRASGSDERSINSVV